MNPKRIRACRFGKRKQIHLHAQKGGGVMSNLPEDLSVTDVRNERSLNNCELALRRTAALALWARRRQIHDCEGSAEPLNPTSRHRIRPVYAKRL